MVFLIKIAVVGDDLDISKSFCEKHLGVMVGPSRINTIGADFYVKAHEWKSNIIKFQSWLLHTQERFFSVRSNFLSGSHTGIIIVNLAKMESFESVQNNVREIWENNGPGLIPIAIIGIHEEIRSSHPTESKITDQLLSGGDETSSNQTTNNKTFVTELKIPYSNDTSIRIYWKESNATFELKFIRNDQEVDFKIIDSDLNEEKAWEILNSTKIEFISMSIVQDVAQELTKIVKNPKGYIKEKKPSDIASMPIMVKSGDIEEMCIQYCEKLTIQTQKLGFDIKYFSINQNDTLDDTLILDYLFKSIHDRSNTKQNSSS